MKIICFPHYTCGLLLCNILNEDSGNYYHEAGKIGDSNTIFDQFDLNDLMAQINDFDIGNKWISSHCWLGPHINLFDKVINVTTETYKSKLYRWLRTYYHYFSIKQDWKDLSGIDYIDKVRETAKSYMVPFKSITADNVINIEFADIVESNTALKKIYSKDIEKYMAPWKLKNLFLYDDHIMITEPAKRFHEAEYEIVTGRNYVYV